MPSAPGSIRPVQLIARMHAQYGTAPSYGQVWGALASGRIPGRRDGQGWHIDLADEQRSAEYFGLVDPRATPAA